MRRPNSQTLATIIILLISMSAVMAVTWLVPSLNAASINMLFRLRGQTPPPEDIVIVAIDDSSLQQIGNWPWPRSVMASALDRLTEAHARVVGLDVIYAEASNTTEDQLLAEAIRRNGRVVLPAQLAEAKIAEAETTLPDTPVASVWLMPLPEFKNSAAAVGHAHAVPDVDGVLRAAQLSKADERGERLWAFGLETLRVASQLPTERVEEQADAVRVGRYEIATHNESEKSSTPGVSVIRANEMLINYLGPPRSFRYYNIVDVIHGHVPASTFTDKIVLIGAVAQTLGDTRITPFISYGGVERSGVGMPGVEVHANIIETIRRGAPLNQRPDALGFVLALLVILGATVIVRLLDGWRMMASLGALLSLILLGSFYVFNHHFIIPPIVGMLTAFLTIVPLLLVHSSMTASRDLDLKLDKLTGIQKRFMSHKPADESFTNALSFLGTLLRARSVALYRKSSNGSAYELKAFYGNTSDRKETFTENIVAESSTSESNTGDSTPSLELPLINESETSGMLLVKRNSSEPFAESERTLAGEFAVSLAGELSAAERSSRLHEHTLPIGLPRNVNWKLRAVDDITSHLIARISFMNHVFTSMTEGVLVADMTGQVVFANPAAFHLFDGLERAAMGGQSLANLLVERGIVEPEKLRETMREVMNERHALMEVEALSRTGNIYTLQFSAVVESDNSSIEPPSRNGDSQITSEENPSTIGLIVIITDITKRRELERVRAETLQLVTHELRTPLTSIQGLSDLLLKFPVEADESQEILGIIYSESVRMNELIKRYLDVTRIEVGTQSIRHTPVEINHLITDCARALSHLATEKKIQIALKLQEPSPRPDADAQLLTQAISNLLANAIKYSPAASQIEIGSMSDTGHACIFVRDQGYGIPPEAQEKIFEKFYRLERDAESDTVGTGLGLPLVKEIIERHGGQVTLDSALDRGSIFTLRLPLQKS